MASVSMFPPSHRSFCFLFIALIFIACETVFSTQSIASKTVSSILPPLDPSNTQPKCEDILRFAFPDLCDLNLEKGSVKIRGVSVVYWRYTNKKNDNDKTPLLLVHGGPGFSHKYILPMKQQACRGREIVGDGRIIEGNNQQYRKYK